MTRAVWLVLAGIASVQLGAAAALDRVHQVRGGLLGEPGKPSQRSRSQVEQLGELVHEAVLDQRVRGLLAQPRDVERAARPEMADPTLHLRGTAEAVGADGERAALLDRTAARGALARHLERLPTLLPRLVNALAPRR